MTAPTRKGRGRPRGSPIRDRMLALLAEHGEMHGYALAQLYLAHHPNVSQRVIYYHLKQAEAKGEVTVRIVKTKGTYSWGSSAERIMYKKKR